MRGELVSWYLILLLAVAVERLAELVLAQRNLAWSRARGAVEAGGGHYPVMVALHLALLLGCVVEVAMMRRPFIPVLGWSMLALVVAAQALRWWCITTLGRQWNTRVVVIPGAARIGEKRSTSCPTTPTVSKAARTLNTKAC